MLAVSQQLWAQQLIFFALHWFWQGRAHSSVYQTLIAQQLNLELCTPLFRLWKIYSIINQINLLPPSVSFSPKWSGLEWGNIKRIVSERTNRHLFDDVVHTREAQTGNTVLVLQDIWSQPIYNCSLSPSRNNSTHQIKDLRINPLHPPPPKVYSLQHELKILSSDISTHLELCSRSCNNNMPCIHFTFTSTLVSTVGDVLDLSLLNGRLCLTSSC